MTSETYMPVRCPYRTLRLKRVSSWTPGASRSCSLTRRSLTGRGLCGHLALSFVREQLRRLLERQPARLGDFVSVLGRDLPEPPAAVAEEEEAHDLEDPLACPGVDVADVAQLLDGGRLDPCLLGDLAQRGELGALARRDEPLREGPRPFRLAGRPDGGHHMPSTQPADDHPARRELPAHRDFVTQWCVLLAQGRETALEWSGTQATRVPMVVTKSSEQEGSG